VSILLLLFVALFLRRKEMAMAEEKTTVTYHRVLFLLIFIWLLFSILKLVFLWLENEDIEPPTATTLKQTWTCSVIGFIRFSFVDMTDCTTFVVFVETFAVLCRRGWSNSTIFFLRPDKRFKTYVACIFVWTSLQLAAVATTTGFGRHNKGCSWRITRPGGIPTYEEEMTYYSFNFVLFGATLVIVGVTIFHLRHDKNHWVNRSILLRMTLLPVCIVSLWLPKLFRRLFVSRDLDELKDNIDRVNGFLNALALLCFNLQIRSALKYLCMTKFTGTVNDQPLLLGSFPEDGRVRSTSSFTLGGDGEIFGLSKDSEYSMIAFNPSSNMNEDERSRASDEKPEL
jgi:hypothetical protein